MANLRPIPAIMYHSVRPTRNTKWVYSHLTLELPFFVQQLEYFKRSGYYVASLQELIEFKRGHRRLPEKCVCLTFDDGYLDNWAFAFPLLKKYGFRATIFVSPEFVQADEGVRPTLEDCWAGRCQPGDLVCDGFLSWEELRRMQESGIIEVESHTMTHTFYPVSDEIIDFHHPGDSYVWMAWNAEPAKKSFYMMAEQPDPIPLGAPVYRCGKALVARRVQEDGTLTKYTTDYVRSYGGTAFFSRPDWRSDLFAVATRYREMHPVTYRHETESDYLPRLNYELQESKRVIEEQLDKPVRVLCWPNGGWNDETHALALEAGYEATTAKGSSNVFSSPDPTRILRMGLHQVGESKIISRLFITYALNAHRQIWPYAQLRRALARVGATPVLKKLLYRGG